MRSSGLSSGSEWMAYAQWGNEQEAAVDFFGAEWTVPPEPRERSGQTVFIFLGLQNARFILQSVLQWGPSLAGGGSCWSLANWYTDGIPEHSRVSACQPVEPGQLIRPRIELLAQEGRCFSYRASFEGYEGLDLHCNGVVELLWAFLVLETKGLRNGLQYPASPCTRIDSIVLQAGGICIRPGWKLMQGRGGIDMPRIVADSGDAISILYPFSPPG